MTKEIILASLNELPEKFSLDEFIERLIALQKVEEALQQVRNGEVVSEAEARKQLAKWL